MHLGYNVQQVMTILGISRRTVYHALRDGRLTRVNGNRAAGITKESVARFARKAPGRPRHFKLDI
jgi:hypothetical protein